MFMGTEYEEWLASRPQIIKDMVARWPHDVDYTMGDDTETVYRIYSYFENGTVIVTRFLDLIPIWNVFGVDPNTLNRLVPDDISALTG